MRVNPAIGLSRLTGRGRCDEVGKKYRVFGNDRAGEFARIYEVSAEEDCGNPRCDRSGSRLI